MIYSYLQFTHTYDVFFLGVVRQHLISKAFGGILSFLSFIWKLWLINSRTSSVMSSDAKSKTSLRS